MGLARIFHPRVVKVLFLLMLAAPLAVRAGYVDSNIHLFTGTRFLGAGQVLANDALIYALILCVFYLSFLARVPRLVAVLLRGVGFLVYGVYAMDVAVLVSFNTHITVEDTLAYAGYAPRYIVQVSRKRDVLMLGSGVLAAGFALWVMFSRYTLRRRGMHVMAGLLLVGLLLGSCFTDNARYTHAWMYRNFIAYNLEVRSEGRAYSDGFVSGFEYEEKWVSEPKTAEYPNVIVLMVESLSSYQSRYFSGLNDWTPNLDRIAEGNVAYTGFYANGYSTNDCYIALLSGRVSIRPPARGQYKRGDPFLGFRDSDRMLPAIMSGRGYATEFLIAGDLGFSGVGDWARAIEFGYIEGNQHAFYDGWDRYHFNSAPDEALYGRVIERMKYNEGRKYFMYLSTLSTHHPFVNPENGDKSEVQTIRYGDKQLGLFYDRLLEMGFFEDGVLIILGDHHAMVPLKKGEVKRFGAYRAAARVPMVVAYGGRKRGVVEGLHSQVDVFNGLKNMTSSTLRTSDWAGDLFHDRPAKYVAHRRGDYRDVVSVFTEDKDYLVKLDGDDTRVVDGEAVGDEIKRELVGRVNALRVMGRED
jgi:sulfatase-like protein